MALRPSPVSAADAAAAADLSERGDFPAPENSPSSLAERAVLAGMMLGDEQSYDVLDILAASDFASPKHTTVYQAACSLYGKGESADVISVCNELEKQGTLQRLGGREWIRGLIDDSPDVFNVRAYAEIVRDSSLLRRLGAASGEIADLARRPQDRGIDEVLNQAEMLVFALSRDLERGTRSEVQLEEAVQSALEHMDRLAAGESVSLPSGFAKLDRLIFGFAPGDMIVLAGRPSAGKTAFALSVARVALKSSGVLMFSLEMSARSIAERMLIMESGVEGSILRQGKMEAGQRKKFGQGRDKLASLKFWLDDTPALSIGALTGRARRLKREHPEIGMIVVDYMQLLRGEKSESRNQEVSAISRDLKALARELELPVLALSQLNRLMEKKSDGATGGQSRSPQLSDLRDSGSIEQDADLVLLLHTKKPVGEEQGNVARSSITEVAVAKHRNGPTGNVTMTFHKQVMRFSEQVVEDQLSGAQVGAAGLDPV